MHLCDHESASRVAARPSLERDLAVAPGEAIGAMYQHLRVPVVGAQRRSSIAKREMCFHLNSNGRFIGRLKVDDALGMPDRGFMVVSPRSVFC